MLLRMKFKCNNGLHDSVTWHSYVAFREIINYLSWKEPKSCESGSLVLQRSELPLRDSMGPGKGPSGETKGTCAHIPPAHNLGQGFPERRRPSLLCEEGVMITINLPLNLKRNYTQEGTCYGQYTTHTGVVPCYMYCAVMRRMQITQTSQRMGKGRIP